MGQERLLDCQHSEELARHRQLPKFPAHNAALTGVLVSRAIVLFEEVAQVMIAQTLHRPGSYLIATRKIRDWRFRVDGTAGHRRM